MDDIEQHHLMEKEKAPKNAKIICNDETFIGYKMS
jgi:hypothetical protein